MYLNSLFYIFLCRCSSCKSWYCSEECHTRHWPSHKRHCQSGQSAWLVWHDGTEYVSPRETLSTAKAALMEKSLGSKNCWKEQETTSDQLSCRKIEAEITSSLPILALVQGSEYSTQNPFSTVQEENVMQKNEHLQQACKMVLTSSGPNLCTNVQGVKGQGDNDMEKVQHERYLHQAKKIGLTRSDSHLFSNVEEENEDKVIQKNQRDRYLQETREIVLTASDLNLFTSVQGVDTIMKKNQHDSYLQQARETVLIFSGPSTLTSVQGVKGDNIVQKNQLKRYLQQVGETVLTCSVSTPISSVQVESEDNMAISQTVAQNDVPTDLLRSRETALEVSKVRFEY